MSLRERTRPGLRIIESCLPSPAKAPCGLGWFHEARDSAGVLLPATATTSRVVV